MILPLRILGPAFALLMLPGIVVAETVFHHEMYVTLSPDNGRLQVRDIITLPLQWSWLRFSLHKGFSPSSPDARVRIKPDPQAPASSDSETFLLSLPDGQSKFTMDYQGKIAQPLKNIATGIISDQKITQGFVARNSVYLDGSSLWYPRFDNELVTFSMTIIMPPTWQAISQGRQPSLKRGTIVWEETQPQEEIYLLAAPFWIYHQAADKIDTEVFLRENDPMLAKLYLPLIGRYIKMYDRLIGPYPYSKFAVVENSWESGYGMPSFTLLGPRVMRLPFILSSSLPHEILHNWWGNGVYVDYRQGNWSEGLTAYLADHLLREQAGDGSAYRRNALQRYTNYISQENDFPLKDFQGRHSEASQAVGYDKALMLFHMLRVQLGDKNFIDALRQIYHEQRFHRANWDDLRRSFEAASHRSLQSEFQQWLARRGAPVLQVSGVRAAPTGHGYELTAAIGQTQSDAPYRLHVPIAVQLEGHQQAWQAQIELSRKHQTIHITVPARPWRLEIDPEFDVFRRLGPGELPPTLSEALGADGLLMVLPSAASAEVRAAYQRLAQTWADAESRIEIRWDKDLPQLPSHRAVWLLGWENRFIDQVSGGVGAQLSLTNDSATLAGQTLRRQDRAVIISARRNGTIRVWLGCDNPAAIPGLARKLPHYGSYSYLAFQGDEPTNTLKGQWDVLNSPLQITIKQEDNEIPPPISFVLAPRAPLVYANLDASSSDLVRTIKAIQK